MKKLSLGKLKVFSDEVLERSQLSEIYGGSSSSGGNCYSTYHCREGGQSAGPFHGSCANSGSEIPGDLCNGYGGVVSCTQAGC